MPFVTTVAALEKKLELSRLVDEVKSAYLLEKLTILLMMLRYASCCHSIRVFCCCRLVIFVLIPETAFSIMDSVSIPLARPVMTFRLPYRLELLLTLLTEAIFLAPFRFCKHTYPYIRCARRRAATHEMNGFCAEKIKLFFRFPLFFSIDI